MQGRLSHQLDDVILLECACVYLHSRIVRNTEHIVAVTEVTEVIHVVCGPSAADQCSSIIILYVMHMYLCFYVSVSAIQTRCKS